MTDNQLTAVLTFGGVIVAAIPTWIVAYGALQQAKRAAILTEKAAAVTIATDEKATAIVAITDQIAHKADEIHTLTNSTLSTAQDSLKLANEQVRTLQNAINKLVEGKPSSADVLVVPVSPKEALGAD